MPLNKPKHYPFVPTCNPEKDMPMIYSYSDIHGRLTTAEMSFEGAVTGNMFFRSQIKSFSANDIKIRGSVLGIGQLNQIFDNNSIIFLFNNIPSPSPFMAGESFSIKITAINSASMNTDIELLQQLSYEVNSDDNIFELQNPGQKLKAEIVVAPSLAKGYISQKVSEIIILNGGSGYTVAPQVVISNSFGATATATAEIINGSVSSVTVTYPGTNYGATPNVTFVGNGNGAAARAVVSPTLIYDKNAIPETWTFTFNTPTSFTASGSVSGQSVSRYELTTIGAMGAFRCSFSGADNGMLSVLVIQDKIIPKFTLTAISETQFELIPGNQILTVGELYRSNNISIKIADKSKSKYLVGESFSIINFGAKEIFTVDYTQPPDPLEVDPNAPAPAPAPAPTVIDPSLPVPPPPPKIIAPALLAMRQKVNTESNLITMPERGTDRLDTGGNDGDKDSRMKSFNYTNLTGGSGSPTTAHDVKTGPDRALIRIVSSEDDDGKLVPVEKIFEWVGSDATVGSWEIYS